MLSTCTIFIMYEDMRNSSAIVKWILKKESVKKLKD